MKACFTAVLLCMLLASFGYAQDTDFERIRNSFSDPRQTKEISSNLLPSFGETSAVWFCSRYAAPGGLKPGETWNRPRPWYRLEFLTDESDQAKNSGLNPIQLYVRLPRAESLAGTADRSEVEYLRMRVASPAGTGLLSEVTIGRNHPEYALWSTMSEAMPGRKVTAYIECPEEAVQAHSVILEARDRVVASGIKGLLRSGTIGSCGYRRTVTKIEVEIKTPRLQGGTQMLQTIRSERVDDEIYESRSGISFRINGADGTEIQQSKVRTSLNPYRDIAVTQLSPWIRASGLTTDEAQIGKELLDWVFDGRCGD